MARRNTRRDRYPVPDVGAAMQVLPIKCLLVVYKAEEYYNSTLCVVPPISSTKYTPLRPAAELASGVVHENHRYVSCHRPGSVSARIYWRIIPQLRCIVAAQHCDPAFLRSRRKHRYHSSFSVSNPQECRSNKTATSLSKMQSISPTSTKSSRTCEQSI
ncbi:hypothetical protein K440DRAFT_370680 [Wilcoxina mikolae CBS 423.85]|nr:hypothetical protein K440DRAFT_370680 [Wilcoxina mikolae CBS 423.85]